MSWKKSSSAKANEFGWRVAFIASSCTGEPLPPSLAHPLSRQTMNKTQNLDTSRKRPGSSGLIVRITDDCRAQSISWKYGLKSYWAQDLIAFSSLLLLNVADERTIRLLFVNVTSRFLQ